jgi:hypothetical protein
VAEYIDDLSELFDSAPENFKLVFKGKILTWKQNAQECKLNGATVMVVINNVKKSPKKVLVELCSK